MSNHQSAPVYLISSRDRPESIHRIFEEAGVSGWDDARVAIKANYNSDDPFPASTHPETLEALVREIQGQHPREIVLGERSGMGDTASVLEGRGIMNLSGPMGFRVEVLDDLPPEDWKQVNGEGYHWKNGFYIARLFTEADVVIQTCCLKTHRFGGHFTLSLKNSVGLVAKRVKDIRHDFMTELHTSLHQRSMIAEINAHYPVHLAVMDASLGFRDRGPEKGTIIRPGLFLASSDRVALDAVGVALLRKYGTTTEVMRGRIFEQEQIARAVELGIGVSSPSQIDLQPLDGEGEMAAAELQMILDSQG